MKGLQMPKCEYDFKDLSNWSCDLEVWEGSEDNLCLFHDPTSHKPQKEFREKFRQQLSGKIRNLKKGNFSGYRFPDGCCDIDNMLMTSTGCGVIDFKANFNHAVFEDITTFEDITFKTPPTFIYSEFKHWVSFNRSKFKMGVQQEDRKHFYPHSEERIIDFANAKFKAYLFLNYTNFESVPDFTKAKFKMPLNQEHCCRKARIRWEEEGNRGKADQHFVREMQGKRKNLGPKRKNAPLHSANRLIALLKNYRLFNWNREGLYQLLFERPISWIVDMISAYGTSWKRLLITWIIVIFAYGCLFSCFNILENEGPISLLENFYLSIITFTTLGYGHLPFKKGAFQIVAGFESVVGGVLMAAFVIIFARKYMR